MAIQPDCYHDWYFVEKILFHYGPANYEFVCRQCGEVRITKEKELSDE